MPHLPHHCSSETELRRIDVSASATPAAPVLGEPVQGGPNGAAVGVNTRSLTRDGRPWLPMMGEIHFSRVPEAEWREALLRMKAGGIGVVATYVFWIHHEEVEGELEWGGQRNLRRFAETCAALDLPLVARIGPWCHGEVRNGGLPDWLVASGTELRANQPAYLQQARRWYAAIAEQLRGLLWQTGGPVIGIQLENEYGGPAEHLLELKRMAQEVGLEAPVYTRTGWPALQTPMPPGEILPLYGAYAEGFWDRSLESMPGSYWTNFTFSLLRSDAAIATDLLGEREAADQDDPSCYPFLTCEIGGGMMSSYHRRIRIAAADIEAVALCKLGSGSGLLGFYMYNGGINPAGRLSTLQETQATGYWNDLPAFDYDFQAPLGACGQVREHCHRLRRLAWFMEDFAAELSATSARLPAERPKGKDDEQTLRWSVRSDGSRGFLFVNRYQRGRSGAPSAPVRFAIRFAEEEVALPSRPVVWPAEARCCWPLRLDLGIGTLIYATAQLFARIRYADTECYFLSETTGVPVECLLQTNADLEAANPAEAAGPSRWLARGEANRNEPLVRLQSATGERVAIFVWSEEDSLRCWRGDFAGGQRLVVTDSVATFAEGSLRLRGQPSRPVDLALFPPLEEVQVDGRTVRGEKAGWLARYAIAPIAESGLTVTAEQVRAPGNPPPVSLGALGVAQPPGEEAFAAAGVWRIRFSGEPADGDHLLLRVRYRGDLLRWKLGQSVIGDSFWHGEPADLALWRFDTQALHSGELSVEILPLRNDAPIALPEGLRLNDSEEMFLAVLDHVEVVEERELLVTG
jgi:beta-galactosidase